MNRHTGITEQQNNSSDMAGSDQYPNDWHSRRQTVLDRDDYQCRNCGVNDSEEQLHVHHIVPISAGGAHDTTNLATLCKPCHMATHGQLRRVETPERVDTLQSGFSGDSDDNDDSDRDNDSSNTPEVPPTRAPIHSSETVDVYRERRQRLLQETNLLTRLWWKFDGVPDSRLYPDTSKE